MKAADLPFGTIIADGPRVMVKLKSAGAGHEWHHAMNDDTRSPCTDAEADWALAHGYTVVRHGLDGQ